MAKPPRSSIVTAEGQVSIPAALRQELPEHEPQGALRVLGFARRFREARPTAAWMAELREGEGKR